MVNILLAVSRVRDSSGKPGFGSLGMREGNQNGLGTYSPMRFFGANAQMIGKREREREGERARERERERERARERERGREQERRRMSENAN